MPASHVRIDDRPSNPASLRCTTTNTSCTTSSPPDGGTPRFSTLRQTNAKCSSYTASNDGAGDGALATTRSGSGAHFVDVTTAGSSSPVVAGGAAPRFSDAWEM